MKKILIVGATGFIGRNLYDFFENKGEYETTALKRSDVDLYDEEAVENYLRVQTEMEEWPDYGIR